MAKPHFRRLADGRTFMMTDGFQNVVANLNTGRDKASHGTYRMRLRSYHELVSAYRTAWLPKKVVNIPPDDATRRWREWQGSAPDTSKIEAEEKRLNLVQKLREAMRMSRLYGGAAIYIGTKDSDLGKELDVEKIGKGDVTHLTVLNRLDLTAGELDRTPGSKNFNEPAYFNVNMQKIHPSRLVLLPGESIPDWQRVAPEYWGDSVLLSVFDALASADSTGANMASLVYEASVDVLHIPRLMKMLSEKGGDQKVSEYLMTLAMAKGNNGMLVLDGGDTSVAGQQSGGTEFDRKSITFGGLGDVWDRMMQAASGAADIPMTRLLGQSPAGMNSTGEGDLRNYYDRVQTIQELDISPAMAVLDRCLVRSALGRHPKGMHFNWRPLWQTTQKDRAEAGKITVETLTALKSSGLYPDEVLQVAGTAAIAESGIMPGLETAIDELGGWEKIRKDMAEEADSEADEILAAGQTATPDTPGQTTQVVGDAAPRTLYVKRDVLNGDEIIAWAKTQGFKTTLAASDMHVTIVYSKMPVDWMKIGEAWAETLELPAGGPRIMEAFGPMGRAKVLTFASSALQWRHMDAKAAGASSDYEEYQPHITISYGEDEPDLATIEPYRGRIVLGPEIFTELNTDWQPQEVSHD